MGTTALSRVLSGFQFGFRFVGHEEGSPFPVRKVTGFSVLMHGLHLLVPAVGDHKSSQLEHRFGIFFTPEKAVALET